MALTKQAIPLSFTGSLDQKSDPLQLAPNSLLALNNVIFTKSGQLAKRNGYAQLGTLPSACSIVTAFQGNLTAIGKTCYAYSTENQAWVSKGAYQPLALSVLPLVRSSYAQSAVDMAVASNGLICTAFLDGDGNYKYQVCDGSTGQQLVGPVSLPSGANQARVFANGNYFIVTFLIVITATPNLQYIAIPLTRLSSPSAATSLSANVLSATTGYDGTVAQGNLYLSWTGSDGGGAIRTTYLDGTLTQHGVTITTGYIAPYVSVTVDVSTGSPVVWTSFYVTSTTKVWAFALNSTLQAVLAPTQIDTGVVVTGITSVATGSLLSCYYEISNTYTYSSTRSDYIKQNTITLLGVVGTASILARSVGLGSKAFLIGSSIYMLAAYAGTYQPSYYVLNASGQAVGRLAYSNGAGYATTQVLSNVSVTGLVAQMGYLLKDLVQAVNKTQGVASVSGIYTQTGVNAASFNFGAVPQTAELSNQLSITGGFLWSYDGNLFSEQNFNVWPEDFSLGQPIGFAGSGSATIGSASLTSYVGTTPTVGMTMYGASTPANTTVTAVNGTTITLSNNLTVTGTVYVTFANSLDNALAFSANTTNGSPTITTSGSPALSVGMYVTGFGMPAGVYITAISGATVTLSANAAATSTPASLAAYTLIGGLSSQKYFYQATYEWTDAQGNVNRSAPSVPQLVTVVAQTGTFTSVFSANVSSITVSSANGLYVGQVLTDTTTGANLTSGTYITSINGTTIGLSSPTVGASATAPGDTISFSKAFTTLNIPTLRLSFKSSVRIVIYRWSTAQQAFYQVTSVTSPLLNNPAVDYVTYNDTTPDAAIIGNALVYTTGGVVEDICAPATNILGLYKSRLFLVEAEDPNTLWYSKQSITNTPLEMSDLLTYYTAPTTGAQGSTGPTTSLAAMDDKLIVFKKDAIYYVTGNGPDNTGANNDFSDPNFITGIVGSAVPQSIVFEPGGLLFDSDKGRWILSRNLSVGYKGAPVEGLNGFPVNGALAIPGTNQVRFTLSGTSQALLYDYFFDKWGTFSNIPAVSSTLVNGLHVYLSSYGQVFQETPGLYLDNSTPVTMSLTTAWFNLAGLQGYQRAYSFFILGQYITPHTLQVSVAYDYNPSLVQSINITPTNTQLVYGTSAPYGQDAAYGGSSALEQWQVFNSKQRCQAYQVTIQELYDPSKGIAPGAGLTLSGLNLIIGKKSGYRPIDANNSVG